jgi:hypothetical protein
MRTGLLALGLVLVVGCGDDLGLAVDDGGDLPSGEAGRDQQAGGSARLEPVGDSHKVAEVLVDDALGATDLVVAGDRIYWIGKSDDGWELRYVRPTGGPVTTVLKFGTVHPGDVLFAGEDVYWIAPRRGRVYRTSMDVPGPSEVLYQDAGAPPTALAAGEKALFVGAADGCVTRIWFGEDPAVEPVACADGTPVAVAAREPDVFWGTAEGILYRAPADGGAADKRLADESFDSRLAIDDSSVYWLNAHARAVQVLERDAHGAKQLASAQYAPVGMVTDDAWVYFTTWSDQSVKRVSKLESPVEVLAGGQAEPADIALHGDRAYWLNEGQGTIMALQVAQP